ncbi:MAG: MCP four helix bundle domain-containing protein, partial [Bradyrhizobium sp.]
MSKLSIRTKIISVIAFMLVTMCGLGVLAVTSMRSINANTVDIATNWLPSVRAIGELRSDINLLRVALRSHVMAETAEAKQAVDQRITGILETINKDRKNYEPLITSPQERAIYDNWVQAWEKYVVVIKQVMDASNNSVGRLPREATDLLEKSAAAIARDADKYFVQDIEFNNKGAADATRDAADSYSRA